MELPDPNNFAKHQNTITQIQSVDVLLRSITTATLLTHLN